ncbi:MAG TPA: hypothetical protein VF980_09475 [Thermoanaerobaculia bacterium]
MNRDEAQRHVRSAFDAIPPVLRPFVVLVVPAVILHAMFMRTPEVLPALRTLPAETTATTGTQAKVDAPSQEEIATLIQQSEEFQAPKKAVCPRSLTEPGVRDNRLYTALRHAGYVIPPADRYGYTNPLVELTPEAHYDLGGDLDEDLHTITLVIGRKVFIAVDSITAPPQLLAPPLRYATRVGFSWRWATTNKIGDFLAFDPRSPRMTGVAYLQRGSNSLWHIAQIDFHDTSTSYDGAM